MVKNGHKLIDRYLGKVYHVVGIGRSGVGIANVLNDVGADTRISDIYTREKLGDYLNDISEGITVVPGRQDRELLKNIDCLVLSPGVPRTIDLVVESAKRGIEVVGELELAYRIIRELSKKTGMHIRWFGITGTNGKSTTVTLLHEMLKREGRNCVLSGNIGYALSQEARRLLNEATAGTGFTEELDIVLELSSFQLEMTGGLKLDVSAFLNITDDHLDRYDSLESYAEAKAGIFRNQEETEHAVINADDALVLQLSEACRAQKHFVSLKSPVEGIFLSEGKVRLSGNGERNYLLDADEIMIKGVHNLFNAMTASLAARLGGVSKENIVRTLRTFPGLAHRLEFVGEKEGVAFYNDSKGTNVGALIKSLESFDGNIILIAGGRDKNGNFEPLGSYLRERVKKVIVIGEASERIAIAVGRTVPVERSVTLKDAVVTAAGSAQRGDTVLFSPACASFDMFRNFEDRGDRFKSIVRELLKGN